MESSMLFTETELEDTLDTTKVSIIAALVRENIVTAKQGEEWAKSHTIVLRKKSVFRTISNLWSKEEETKNYKIHIVKMVN